MHRAHLARVPTALTIQSITLNKRTLVPALAGYIAPFTRSVAQSTGVDFIVPSGRTVVRPIKIGELDTLPRLN